ncbi:MAG TPA: TetR family transcriptional regulator C-terminal domain-containing protein [Candidatus Brevibacterium intestinavium]|jgi:hypothetical protein|nr:TetR family transcriptional regulator C-terminal domain-containing protein [Candidatus Brevibacterium intestinavium]
MTSLESRRGRVIVQGRRSEMEVCPALFAAAGTDPKLIDTRAEVWERAHTGCRTIVTEFLGAMAATDRQREQELIRLHTLVDGLAAHPVRLRARPQRR